jgi:hypothetical protein
MEDVNKGRELFNVLDENGKASTKCYNEKEVYHMLERIGELSSGNSDTSSEKPKHIRGMFKRSF